jgi:hypothetical protein
MVVLLGRDDGQREGSCDYLLLARVEAYPCGVSVIRVTSDASRLGNFYDVAVRNCHSYRVSRKTDVKLAGDTPCWHTTTQGRHAYHVTSELLSVMDPIF